MKKKMGFLLIQVVMMMVLSCACSTGAKEEETIERGEPEEVSVEPAVPEQSDDETEEEAESKVSPDLNHNGIVEEVRVMDMDDGQGQRLEIWENNELIDSEEGYFASYGSTSIFLCTLEGEDYLLRYYPTMYQGVCTYRYTLYTLKDNEKSVVRWNEVDFDINFGSPIHMDFDPEAIAAFMDEMNDLLSHSVQMLNTDSELQATFEKEGRLYDSLWWLDNREPEFIRDESKSLMDNLRNFQTAMEVAREPAIPEETGGLPITEPLEMAFYSGAGAWATYLTLNPDGSFVGDYADADVLTVYVCQFHGKFEKVEKLTNASWLLTLSELELDTSHSVGEEWDEPDGDYTIHYVSSEPYGFYGADGTALKPGAQFILYSPEASGHEPGTELYGAIEFQSWIHDHHEFTSDSDILGCWGLQNMETGHGFFGDSM